MSGSRENDSGPSIEPCGIFKVKSGKENTATGEERKIILTNTDQSLCRRSTHIEKQAHCGQVFKYGFIIKKPDREITPRETAQSFSGVSGLNLQT